MLTEVCRREHGLPRLQSAWRPVLPTIRAEGTCPVDPLLDPLNPAQRAAVEHIDGPMLVLAGPGSGKTRVVTHRIANLLRSGVGPGQILALTFTNKAAEEMHQRVEHLAPGQRVWVSTFHRFGARLLRQFGEYVGLPPNFTIYDTSDARQTLKRVIEAGKIRTAHYTLVRKIDKKLVYFTNQFM